MKLFPMALASLLDLDVGLLLLQENSQLRQHVDAVVEQAEAHEPH